MNELFYILATLLFSAFFSGMEIAFLSTNKLKLELDKKTSGIASKIITIITKKDAHFIVAMLVGNNIVLVIYGMLMSELLKGTLQPFIDSSILLISVQTVLSTLVILVVAEFLPKAVFRINPNNVLRMFSVPLLLAYYILFPFVLLFVFISKQLLKRVFGVALSQDQYLFNKVDLDEYLTTLKVQQHTNEVEMLQNALELPVKKARECMVPRTDIVAVDIDISIEELKQVFIQSKLSKILVYKKSMDNIVGYIHSLDLFKKPKQIKSILLPITFVPETMVASDILTLFIDQRKGIALVVDEYGGTSGMITVEDLTEEIVGEIEDEHDNDELTEQQLDENTFLLSARLEVESINKKYHIDLPIADDYETLSGLFVHFYKDIPEIETKLDIGNYRLVVKKVNETSIQIIELHIL